MHTQQTIIMKMHCSQSLCTDYRLLTIDHRLFPANPYASRLLTIDHRPSTISSQSLCIQTIDYRPMTIDHRPISSQSLCIQTIDYRPSTIDYRLFPVNPSASSPATISFAVFSEAPASPIISANRSYSIAISCRPFPAMINNNSEAIFCGLQSS